MPDATPNGRRATAALLASLRLLAPYLPRRYRWQFLLLAIIGVATGLAEAIVLSFVSGLAAQFAGASESATTDLPFFGPVDRSTMLGLGLVLAGVTIPLRLLESFLTARLGSEPLAGLRFALLRAHLSAASADQRADRTGELQDLLMTHVTRAGFLVHYIAGSVPAVAMFLVLAGAAAVLEPLGFVVVIVVVILLAVATMPLQRVARRFGRRENEASLRFAADAAEAETAATEVRLFDVGAPVEAGLLAGARDVSRQVEIVATTTRFMPHLYRALVLALLLVGLSVAGDSGRFNLASAGTMILLLMRALMSSQVVNTYLQSAAECVPFVEEIEQRLDRYRQVEVQRGSAELGVVDRVELRHVVQSYDGSRPVLDGADLVISGGERIGLLGPSGSGKSTVLALILGLADPVRGECLVNGLAPSAYEPGSWSRHVAAVPQDPLLLTATVAENIRFFRSWITDDDVVTAARAAGIADEIDSWPEGFATRVGQRGARALSGGQRQRVCIARALAGRPSLLVMDEPTSALDLDAEEVVSSTVGALGVDCTVILVSHRRTVLTPCDRLLRLENGRFVALAGSDDAGAEREGSS